MRVLVFHGYLLRGTGSNIYNASLARALVALGHEVHLFCQDRDAASLEFVDAVGRFEGGGLSVEVLREPVRCTAYLPDIGRLLPVYVADEYEGFDARPFVDLGPAEIERYVDANVAAVSSVAAAVRPHAALANHAIMGPAILARALAGLAPYAIKIHGSALEYTVRVQPERFLPYVREGLASAAGVLTGSRHVAERLLELAGEAELRGRVRLGPPGVDEASFRTRTPAETTTELTALAERLAREPAADWGGEEGAAAVLAALDPAEHRIVTYVGKLIVSKGVDLLLAAWPLAAAREPRARLCVVGFGAYRETLGDLVAALGRGDLGAAREIARRGRAGEGGQNGELRHLAAFLDGLAGEARANYVSAAREAMSRVSFTGRLEHGDLPPLLSAADAQVVPSTFPEAFGMVAAEAAACGAFPVCAEHSGLAEVAARLAPALESDLRDLLLVPVDDRMVVALAERLARILALDPPRRIVTRAALSGAAHGAYGWERVAEAVLAVARGELDLVPSALSATSAGPTG